MKLRDAMFKAWMNDKGDLSAYLVARKQLNDFIDSTVLMSGAGHDGLAHPVMIADGGSRISFFEGRLTDLKDVEQRVKALYDKGQVPQSDIDIVEYYRLEAEEALAIEKAQGERVLGQ